MYYEVIVRFNNKSSAQCLKEKLDERGYMNVTLEETEDNYEY